MAEMDLITVSRLNTYVNRVVKSLDPLKSMYVVGELSNFKRYSSGHCYFSLKDKDAQVACVMFSQYANRLDFVPKNGQSVILHASADYYSKSGQFQLQVTSMRMEGLGQLYQAFEALKIKLQEEGLFDESRKRPIPFLPRKIGVITSPSGAVIRDIIHVLRRRNPHFELLLIPASVQGDLAAPSLVEAMTLMNQRDDIDVIIIGRGGGSIEDLWPFNEEAVARAVAQSRIPVVSAVGHETDFTICDFVADLRAPTPSAAAELVMPEYERLESQIKLREEQLGKILLGRFNLAKERLNRLSESRQLKDPQEIIKQRRLYLDRLTQSQVLTNPLNMVETRAQYLDLLEIKLVNSSTKLYSDIKNRLGSASAKLDALSPLKVLGRGYGLVIDDKGKALVSVDQAKRGAKVDLHMQDGRLEATIDEIHKEKS